MTVKLAFLRWWCARLVNALLRPVYRHWQTHQTDTNWRRLDRLVDAADCWPCHVEYDGQQLVISAARGWDMGNEFCAIGEACP